jgi:hypothetical protein
MILRVIFGGIAAGGACGLVRNSFAGFAFGHDGGVEAFAELGGELVEFVVAVDGDGLARGVEDYLAVVAGGGVGAYFFEELGADLAVEVVG